MNEPLSAPLPIRSPCRRLCHVVAGGCPACGRSVQEIQNWLFYTPERRDQIIDHELALRQGLRAGVAVSARGRRLGPQDAPAVQAHFLALTPDDLQQRFGHVLNEAAVARWVNGLDWGGQWLWGLEGVDGLQALAHLSPTGSAHAWELGLSVRSEARRQGLAKELLQAAQQVSQALSLHGTLSMHGAAHNVALRRLGEGGTVTLDRDRMDVRLTW